MRTFCSGIVSFSILVLCQLAGQQIAPYLPIPIPGPVIGMVILFTMLCCKLPTRIVHPACTQLIKYLPLLFIAAGVGVLGYLDEIQTDFAAITSALLLGTLLSTAITLCVGLIIQRYLPKSDKQES